MFKTRSIYIKVSRNLIEITELATNKTVSKRAIQPFSSAKNIVDSFNRAYETIGSALAELEIKTGLFHPRLKIVIQQLEEPKGGLSDIERNMLSDLAEMTGATKVIVLAGTQPVVAEIAFGYL